MKHLYLIRHAKAIHDNSFNDFDRTLTARGVNDAHIMGALLKQKGIRPQKVISSPAVRALSTAIIISQELAFSPTDIIKKESLYEADFEDYMMAIHQTADSIDTLFIFAHNPTITEVCNGLGENTFIDNLPTAAVIGLSFDVGSWKKIKTGKGKVNLAEFPKSHRLG